MTKLKILTLLILVFSIVIPQTKILLCDFEPRGVDTSLIRLTTQLLRDAINATYKFLVVEPPPGTKCYSVIAAAELAKKYDAPRH